jgi:O-antigen/teichoic acid export membrane protein
MSLDRSRVRLEAPAAGSWTGATGRLGGCDGRRELVGSLRIRSASGNAIATLVARGVTTLAQALAFSIVAKTYGVDSLDSYALGFTIATFASLVLDFGTGTWVTRQVALGQPALTYVVARVPLLALGLIAALVVALSGVAPVPETLAIVAMSIAIAISLLGQGLFWGRMMHEREMCFAVAESCLVLLFLAGNHFAILPGGHPLVYTAAAYVIGASARCATLLRKDRPDLGAVDLGSWWRQMRSYGMQSLVTIASTQLDTLLLAALVVGNATGTVAAYALAMRVYYAAPMPLQALGAALLPRFVREPGRQLRVALMGTAIGSLVACTAAVAFVLIVPVFGYGASVVAQLRTVMEILSLAFLARCVAYVLGAFVTAQGGQHSRLWSSVAALGSMVALDFLLIPPYGAKGAAVAMVISDWVLFLGYLLGTVRIIRLQRAMPRIRQATVQVR